MSVPKLKLYAATIDTLEGHVEIWLNADTEDEAWSMLEEIPLVTSELKEIAELVKDEEH